MSKYKAERLQEFLKTVELLPNWRGASASSKSLRVLTWNVFRFQFVSELEQLVALFTKANADVVCLQEVDETHPAYKKLLVHLQQNGYADYHFAKSFGEEGLLTLSKFPVASWTHIYMPGKRCALLAKLSDKNPLARKVSLVNVHMDCQDLTGTLRRSQLRTVLDFCDLQTMILAGDMNACHPLYETEPSWRQIQKHDKEDRDVVTPTLYFDLLHDRGMVSINSPLTVPVTVWSARVVDHIVVHKQCFRGTTAVMKSTLSDHLPVVGDLL